MLYSKKVYELFQNPQNVGRIDNPDGIGVVTNHGCNDTIEITIKVQENKISDIKFRTLGCASAIASSSMTTILAKGATIQKALAISKADVAAELDGLPSNKLHCSNLAITALHKAIEDFNQKQKEKKE
jgi:nitrogen fixation NifU-like protein